MSNSNTLPLPGNHIISLHYAIQLTSHFRNNRELIISSQYKGQDILPLSETFNRSDIDLLLAQQDVAGLRIYYGMDSENKVHAVLVPVNINNQDMLSGQDDEKDEGRIIVQEGQRCPAICPPASPLNT